MATANLWRRFTNAGDSLVTSWMTIAEVQVKPRKFGDEDACTEFKQAIIQAAEIVPFAEEAAKSYLNIRATTSIKGPDAIQLACAAAQGVELFITNDGDLCKLRVPGNPLHRLHSNRTSTHQLSIEWSVFPPAPISTSDLCANGE